MKRLIYFTVLTSLGMISTAQALPKIEGNWSVAQVEKAMKNNSFYETGKARCNAAGHCTRVFVEDEAGTRVHVAINRAGRVYRLECVLEVDDNQQTSRACTPATARGVWKYFAL